MMKRNWLIGIIAACAMLTCGTSFASQFSDNGVYSEPIYDTVAFTADTADPLDVAMATSGDLGENDEICMASCNSDKRMSLSYYQVKSGDSRIPRTVPAYGWQSESMDTPTKIPISI